MSLQAQLPRQLSFLEWMFKKHLLNQAKHTRSKLQSLLFLQNTGFPPVCPLAHAPPRPAPPSSWARVCSSARKHAASTYCVKAVVLGLLSRVFNFLSQRIMRHTPVYPSAPTVRQLLYSAVTETSESSLLLSMNAESSRGNKP